MTQTYLRDTSTRYGGKRRALFYDRTSSAAFTTLREMPDSALEYFSYALRKKWAADFANGSNTLVPGHLAVVIDSLNPNFTMYQYGYYAPNNFPSTYNPYGGASNYTNLMNSAYSNSEGAFINHELVNVNTVQTRPDNTSPAPGYDLFSDQPLEKWGQVGTTYGSGGSKIFFFFRQDLAVPTARTTTDFQDYGYLTNYDIDRVEGSEVYLVAESGTTGMTDGVDKFKLEASTPVNDTSLGDSHKLLIDCENKQINLKQIGTGRSFGTYGSGRTIANDTTYSGGTTAETDVIEYLFSDIEKRIREQEVGAVRLAAFQDSQLETDLQGLNISGNFYDFNKWDWNDLGVFVEDTRVQNTGGDLSTYGYVLVQQFNMYVNADYANNSEKPSLPTYNNSTIKLLKPFYGTDQSDGRRLIELEIDETSDFMVNFLYPIFQRRYPVYDFYTTNYGYGNSNGLTFAGTITDTHHGFSQGVNLSGGTYTRTQTVDFNTITSHSKHMHFQGLRGQTGVNVPNPTL